MGALTTTVNKTDYLKDEDIEERVRRILYSVRKEFTQLNSKTVCMSLKNEAMGLESIIKKINDREFHYIILPKEVSDHEKQLIFIKKEERN